MRTMNKVSGNFRAPKASQSPTRKSPGAIAVALPKIYKLCKFPHRKCSFLSLENYDYCLKHILEDKNAPYRPCPFLYTVTGKKCGKPAYRYEHRDSWYCPKHSRHAQRIKGGVRRVPPETPEGELASLAHYAPLERPAVKKDDSENEETASNKKCKAVNPLVDIDAIQVNACFASQILDYASESDSDVDMAMLDNVWRAQDQESSDAESVDSQGEDPLKHACTYTVEEATSIFRDKMIRLQSLYIDQFRRLNYQLRERRKKFLHDFKKEKETLSSIHGQEISTAKELKLYQKLKALNNYHKYYGQEAVLHKKALERRAEATDGHQSRTSHKGKCIFTEGGVKCGEKTIPATKYCRKHILEDTNQRLFRACGYKRDDHVCQEPTLNVFENTVCFLHINLSDQRPQSSGIKCQVKHSVSSTGQNITNTHVNNETIAMMSIEKDLSVQDILKPMEADFGTNSESENILNSSTTITEMKSPEDSVINSGEQISDKVSPYENRVEPLGDEPSSSNFESASKKLDTEKTPDLSFEKQETVGDELVMVDMMTDVGVVEEVLEAQQEGVESVQEEVGLEQETKQEQVERMEDSAGTSQTQI